MEPIRLRDLTLRNPGSPAEKGDLLFDARFLAPGGPAGDGAHSGTGPGAAPDLNLSGLVAFPGLVNSHDHVPGNWYRKIGQPTYGNTYRWLETYRNLPEHGEKASVWVLGVRKPDYERNQDALKRLGVFKNAISGATTVFDHLPRQAPEYYRGNGIRIVEDYRQTHSPRLGNIWGGDTPEAELAAAGDKVPFVVHLAEGTDGEARGELAAWRARGGLRPNLVVIHGVALSEADLAAIAEAGASVVWCPDSNVWLLDAIMDLPAAKRAGVRVALGSDTSMTGSVNLLQEMRLAERYAARFHGTPLPREEIFEQATVRGAETVGMAGEIGRIRVGGSADFLLVDGKGRTGDPLDLLFEATPRDLALVVARGIPLVGDPRFEPLFRARNVPFTRLVIDGAEKLSWLDAREPLAIVNGVLGKNPEWPMLFLDAKHYGEIAPAVAGPR